MVAKPKIPTRRVFQVVVIASLIWAPAAAGAGPLSRTSKSIGSRTHGSSGHGGGSSRPTHTPTTHRGGYTPYDGGCCGSGGVVTVRPVWAVPPRYRLVLAPKVELFFGLQSVAGSDYAGDVRARVYQGRLGFAVEATSYFERFDGPNLAAMGSTSLPRGEDTRMDMWQVTIDGALLKNKSTTLWLRGGLGAVRSTDFDQIYGPTVGVEVSHKLGRDLSVRSSVRQLWFEYDVSAREYRAELTASILSVGYRVLTFNVGDPLRGPTVGLRFGF